jgi:hypothetical protein
MSRSNSEQGESPASKKFEWKSEVGTFGFYNREKKEVESIPFPFRFMILDKLSTIKGFSKADKSGFWSNDVRDTRNQKLTVRTTAGIIAEGLYQDIKDKINAKGAKYATQLYIAYFEDKVLTIGTLTLVGAANSAFIDFSKDNNIYKGAIAVSEFKEEKNGSNEYNVPIFKKVEVSEESENKSIELDKKVQIYLTQYFATYNQPPAPKQEQSNEPEYKPEPKQPSKSATAREMKSENAEEAGFNVNVDDGNLPF